MRTRELPDQIEDITKCTARYHRLALDLVNRVRPSTSLSEKLLLTAKQAERLSAQTGSWVYLAMHHVTANKPFIHYSSARLRTEGGVQANNLANAVSTLMSALHSARRAELVALNIELARIKAANEAERELAEQLVKKAMSDTDAMAAENERLRAEVAELRAGSRA